MASSCRTSGPSQSVLISYKVKMDALASDLTHALDESQLPQYHRKRRGLKRRTKHGSSNLGQVPPCNRLGSDDSSSSIGDVGLSQDRSSLPLTDSDEPSPSSEPRVKAVHITHHRLTACQVESDSVNDNFSPARSHNRRKQKCKRMALDPEIPSTSAICQNQALLDKVHSIARKKKLHAPSDMDNRHIEILGGKRKRGKERNVEWSASRRYVSGRQRVSSHCHSLPVQNTHGSQTAVDECMDYECPDESNIESSSESEDVYTCDEGREADDEQSDWFAETGPVSGVPWAACYGSGWKQKGLKVSWWNDDNLRLFPSTKALFKERYERMSQENQQACRVRFQKLRERLLRREIRAGRRRLQERRPGFSIVSSVNEKVSRFLQDTDQCELRLKPLSDTDRDQLNHLANLYSLNVRLSDDCSSPILTKTRNTITFQRPLKDGGSFPGGLPFAVRDLKRRRKTPPRGVQNLTEGSNDSVDSVFINNSASSSGSTLRPPVPAVNWDDDVGECCADSLSERLADSEPDPLPSPSSLALHNCTL